MHPLARCEELGALCLVLCTAHACFLAKIPLRYQYFSSPWTKTAAHFILLDSCCPRGLNRLRDSVHNWDCGSRPDSVCKGLLAFGRHMTSFHCEFVIRTCWLREASGIAATAASHSSFCVVLKSWHFDTAMPLQIGVGQARCGPVMGVASR
jgi:hypothetical protein